SHEAAGFSAGGTGSHVAGPASSESGGGDPEELLGLDTSSPHATTQRTNAPTKDTESAFTRVTIRRRARSGQSLCDPEAPRAFERARARIAREPPLELDRRSSEAGSYPGVNMGGEHTVCA